MDAKAIDEFLTGDPKTLRLATVDANCRPHVVPVWYMYRGGRFYIGSHTATTKVRNIRANPSVAFAVDVGTHTPDVQGVVGTGTASIVTDDGTVRKTATQVLERYFKTSDSSAIQGLLNDTNCIIEIRPARMRAWNY